MELPTFILERHAALSVLCRDNRVQRMTLCGCPLAGAAGHPPDADLDFMVVFGELEPTEYAEAFLSLKTGLASLFGRRVDLLTEDVLCSQALRQQVGSARFLVFDAGSLADVA